MLFMGNEINAGTNRRKDNAMKRMVLCSMCLLLVPLMTAGCGEFRLSDVVNATWTDNQRLAAADTGFQTAIAAVTVLRKQSAFTVDQGKLIDLLADSGDSALNRWRAAIELNQPTSGFRDQVGNLTRELTAMRISVDRGTEKGVE